MLTLYIEIDVFHVKRQLDLIQKASQQRRDGPSIKSKENYQCSSLCLRAILGKYKVSSKTRAFNKDTLGTVGLPTVKPSMVIHSSSSVHLPHSNLWKVRPEFLLAKSPETIIHSHCSLPPLLIREKQMGWNSRKMGFHYIRRPACFSNTGVSANKAGFSSAPALLLWRTNLQLNLQ